MDKVQFLLREVQENGGLDAVAWPATPKEDGVVHATAILRGGGQFVLSYFIPN